MYFNNLYSKAIIIFTFIIFIVSGCYKIRFYHDTELLREKHDGEIKSSSLLFTQPELERVALISSVCPNRASLVEIEQSLLDGFYNFFSLGIYSTHTIKVWCKRGKIKK